MAKIVLGLGTSHGPMLSTPPSMWDQRVAADHANTEHWYKGKTYDFEALVQLRKSSGFGEQAKLEVWRNRHTACRQALDELAKVFDEARVDVAVVVGNDQMEIFSDVAIPAIAVYRGAEIPNFYPKKEDLARLPPGIEVSVPGHVSMEGAMHPGHAELATRIIEGAIKDHFDVASLGRLPEGATHIPHAFGFIYRQIMKDRAVPTVPVFFNTFYPPNQPTAQRCYDFGKSLVRSIQSWETDARVALIASGGLTHFVIDEDIDNAFFEVIHSQRIDALANLGETIFQAGTSEIKNWIPVAGAMADLGFAPTVVNYVPCYRTEAGTGNAMGFVHWLPSTQ